MRAVVVRRYERTILLSLRCLSISSFLLLVLLVLGFYSILGNLVLLGSVITSALVTIRSFFNESRREVFDLTTPIIFDRRILAFQSQNERYAVFFAFKAPSSELRASDARRILTILMKILPVSTVCSFEWPAKGEFFVNFFIKLEKESFLTRVKELVENISNNLTTLFDYQRAQMLKGEELVMHFSLGMVGGIQRVVVRGKNTLLLKNEISTARRHFSAIGPVGNLNVNDIFDQKTDSQNFRVIFSLKREETNLRIFDSLVIISTEPIENSQFSEHGNISKIPTRTAMKRFGDLVSRNLIVIPSRMYDYNSGAQLIFRHLTSVDQIQRPGSTQDDPTQLGENLSPLTWRVKLAQLSSILGLSYNKDVQFPLNEVPTRLDAQISNLFFVIISQNEESQINWIVQRCVALLNANEHHEVCFLITSPTQTNLLEEKIAQTRLSSRIHVISSEANLELVLKKSQDQSITNQYLTQVA